VPYVIAWLANGIILAVSTPFLVEVLLNVIYLSSLSSDLTPGMVIDAHITYRSALLIRSTKWRVLFGIFIPTAREWVFVYMDESAIGANVFRGNGVFVCNLYYYETRFQYCSSSVMSWQPSHHLHGMFCISYCDIEVGMTYDIDQHWGQTTWVASPRPFCLSKVKKRSLEQKSQKGIN